MRRVLFTGLAVIGFVVPVGPLWAQPAASPGSPATAPSHTQTEEVATKLAGRNRIICRDRIATGSRLAYARDCHTRAEWEEITRLARDYINGQQLKGLNAAPPNS